MARKKPQLEYWLYANRENGGYIRLTKDLMDSEPFLSLSHIAQLLYIRMATAAAGRPEFKYPHSAYKGFVESKAFHRAKQELIDKGFIELVLSGHITKTENIYKFTSLWKNSLRTNNLKSS